MSINSTELDALVLLLNFLDEGTSGKDPVVGEIAGDLGAVESGALLELLFGEKSLKRVQACLVDALNITGRTINEERPTNVFDASWSDACDRRASSGGGVDILIHRNLAAWSIHVLSTENRGSLGGVEGDVVLGVGNVLLGKALLGV